jgi:hypothetical protein
MDYDLERNELIVQTNNEFSPTMLDFEQKMMSVYQAVGLPINDVLVPVQERRKVFKNFMDVLEYVPEPQLESAHFITKFMTAASVGLFDSALNHLWVETIKQLKIRIQQYDIDYFFDVAEIEANFFAGYILVPPVLVYALDRTNDIDQDQIKNLFNVSNPVAENTYNYYQKWSKYNSSMFGLSKIDTQIYNQFFGCLSLNL